MRDRLCRTPARLKSHSKDLDSFFGALSFTMPVEELTLRMASLTNMFDWLTQPQGPHLVDGLSTENPLTALAILIAPKALYDSDDSTQWSDWASSIKLLTYRPPPGPRPILTLSSPHRPRRATDPPGPR